MRQIACRQFDPPTIGLAAMRENDGGADERERARLSAIVLLGRLLLRATGHVVHACHSIHLHVGRKSHGARSRADAHGTKHDPEQRKHTKKAPKRNDYEHALMLA